MYMIVKIYYYWLINVEIFFFLPKVYVQVCIFSKNLHENTCFKINKLDWYIWSFYIIYNQFFKNCNIISFTL